MENYKKCKVENCENKALYKSGQYKGLCNKHHIQLYRYGKIFKRTYRDKNEIIDCGNYYEICLYKGCSEQIEVARTKIDKEDLDKVKDYKWNLDNSTGYVVTNINSHIKKHLHLPLHQLIMGKPPIEYQVDHKFGDKLDNRKYNLRFATNSQNQMNRKNVKGYYWNKQTKKWQTQIMLNGKSIHLGSFTDEQTVANVAKEARLKYFGEFAYKDNN